MFELDTKVVGVSVVLYLLVLIVIWKMVVVDIASYIKIVWSIAMAPIIYLIVYKMSG